jgi:hypothetical protein
MFLYTEQNMVGVLDEGCTMHNEPVKIFYQLLSNDTVKLSKRARFILALFLMEHVLIGRYGNPVGMELFSAQGFAHTHDLTRAYVVAGFTELVDSWYLLTRTSGEHNYRTWVALDSKALDLLNGSDEIKEGNK